MDERARANRRYAAGTAGVLTTLALLSFVLWFFRPPLPDPRTLCPTTRPISGHTLVIVDRTDRWSPAISEALTALLDDAQRNTGRFEKFSIVALDANLSTHPLFSVCNPGEPSFVTDLYRGRRFTRRDFDERFVGAAASVIARIREPAQARTSPIIEYVHRSLGRDDFNQTIANRRLILISDMRQNSDQLSMYSFPPEDELAQLVQRDIGDAGHNVRFDVYFLAHGHDHHVPESSVRHAWDRAFRAIAADYSWRQVD